MRTSTIALRAPLPVQLDIVIDRPIPEPVQAGAYYVVAEALANVHKHAGARRVVVNATSDERSLLIAVVDGGVGGADEEGEGLRAARR